MTLFSRSILLTISRKLLLLTPLLLIAACTSVTVSTRDSTEYMKLRRGDIISSGQLSQPTLSTLHIVGIDANTCQKQIKSCIKTINTTQALNDEQRLSASSELWLMYAMQNQKTKAITDNPYELNQQLSNQLNGYLEAARQAYAYLFYTNRSLDKRALEDRQNQVRDFYNQACHAAVTILSDAIDTQKKYLPQHMIEHWQIETDFNGILKTEQKESKINSFTPDYRLDFKGLRNQYVQDGLGARMVIAMEQESTPTIHNPNRSSPNHAISTSLPWEPMHYISVTALLKFPGNTLQEVLTTHRVILAAYDTWQDHHVMIANHPVPLAANYTAAYGLWLANSDFSSQSIKTLFGKGNILAEPRVYLMQPYQPHLKTLILIHGLASSPEAWVNVANEIMGDDRLRKHYQIWQVYYPTNVPIIINRYEIAKAIEKTFDHYDPQRKNPASHNSVIIGHSMGGILARLLVSSSNNTPWQALNKYHKIDPEKQKDVRNKLANYIDFEPLPEISRAIFIAAPHRGTPFADQKLARLVASLVKLPVNMLKKVTDATISIFGGQTTNTPTINGIDNLSTQDLSIQTLAKLNISPKVTYHSIMGNNTPNAPIKESSDGIVPYQSAHWDGAQSEIIIPSGHSVQETPEAIIEIRRILYEHLNKLPKN